MATDVIPYSVDGAAFDMHVEWPEGPGPYPAVVLFHAWGGRDDFCVLKARLLADQGYVVAAVDLYGIGKRGTDAESSGALMNGLLGDPALLRRRIEQSVAAVGGLQGVDPDRMGAIGFCFGGLCALLAARLGLELRGVVSFHGLLKIGEPLETRPKARILVQHGQDDPMVPPADVAAFAEEMKRVDAEWTLHAYPRVVHAFTNMEANDVASGLAYDADADRRSWAEMKAFFAEVLA